MKTHRLCLVLGAMLASGCTELTERVSAQVVAYLRADAVPPPDRGAHGSEDAPVVDDPVQLDAAESDAPRPPPSVRVLKGWVDASTGRVPIKYPFPAQWVLDDKGARITGPHGLVIDFGAHELVNEPSPNAALRRLDRQAGRKTRRYPTAKSYFEHDLKTWAAGEGLTLVAFYELPEVNRANKSYWDRIVMPEPTRDIHETFGSDWTDATGRQHFVGLYLHRAQYEAGAHWTHGRTRLTVEPAYFEQAKQDLLFAFRHPWYDRESFEIANRQIVEQTRRSRAETHAFISRMNADFNRRFEANKAMAEATNKAIMDGYWERSAANDRMHKANVASIVGDPSPPSGGYGDPGGGHLAVIEGIREVESIASPIDGRTYEVQAGHDQVWLNGNGQVIYSDDPTYDPNRDHNVNQLPWELGQP